MIKINSKPVIARLLKRRTCATLILTNSDSVPAGLLYRLGRLAFMTDMVNEYKDFICVVPLGEKFNKLWNKIMSIASFSKIEEI